MDKKILYVYADLQHYKIVFDDEMVLSFEKASDARNYVLNEKQIAEIQKKKIHDEKILRGQTLVVGECMMILLCVIGAAFVPDAIINGISIMGGAITFTLSQKIIDELNFPLTKKEFELGEYIEKLNLFSSELNRSASYVLENEPSETRAKDYNITYPKQLTSDKPKILQKTNHKKSNKS